MLKTLLRADVAERIGRLYQTGVAPTAKQREEFAAARAARPKLAASLPDARAAASSDPENYAVVGSVAQICIAGVLSEEPDFWAWLMGCDGTTYVDIREAFAAAAADPMVKSVILDVSSPGGYTDGLFETLAAIEAFGKPIQVQASEACSAAYALAAMAGPITPKGPASSFGSIGVACSFAFDSDLEIVDVTSTAAPNKRPDPRTPEGKAVIVEQLDAIHELFADAIARGRSEATGTKYTVAKVNSGFGRGATMLADDAFAAGLIDKKPKAAKRGGSAAIADEGDRLADLVIPRLRATAAESLVEAYEAPIEAGSVARNGLLHTASADSASSKYAKGDRVEALVDHMPGMKGMTGEVEIVRTKPAYYGVKFDGETKTHKWLAEDELKAASEDSMASARTPKSQSPLGSAGQERKKTMLEDELLAQFPALHAAVLAKGSTVGVASERKRVLAHLKLAKATGARDVAEAAIASGASTMDEDVHADYLSAAIGKRETTARQADSDEAGKVLEGAAKEAEGKDLGDQVADIIEAQMGLGKKVVK